MGPYGSVGSHIKTGKRSMAPDHFETPPDPKKGYKNQQKSPKNQKNAPEILSIYGILPWCGYWYFLKGNPQSGLLWWSLVS